MSDAFVKNQEKTPFLLT